MINMRLYRVRAIAAALVCSAALALSAQAQSVDEAALRLSLMLSREVSCAASAPPFSVAAVPAEDASQTLDPQVLAGIEAVILDALRREALECVRITDVARAFDTLSYIQNLGRWETLGAEQRARVTSELSNADATATIVLDRAGNAYVAILSVVELASGRTLASARAEIPEDLTAIHCGASAAAEARGLQALAASLVDRVPRAEVLYVYPATYQDSLDSLGYGRYIADQFIAALSQVEGNVTTGTAVAVRQLADPGVVTLGPRDYAVTLRYWPCDELSAVRLNVVVTSRDRDVVTLGQDLSLAALPAGLEVVPPGSETSNELLDVGFIDIEPRLIRVGQVLSISAAPPADCTPFFFDLSASGQLTPIPLHIFDTTEIRPGVLRYDNNASSRYGIIVQPEDELGRHRLGFICQPSGLNQDDVRDVLRRLQRQQSESANGSIQTKDQDVVFNTMTYEILR